MSTLRFVLVCVAAAVPALAGAGEIRTWTDNQGRQIEAEFIRVFNGAAMLKQGNRIVRVPLTNLSQADQDFVKNGGEDPAAENDQPPAIDRPSEPQKRHWTDRRGNQIEATLVRVHENQIVLSAGGRVKTFPFEDFSERDHAYVREWLIEQGQQAEADAMDQYLASRANQAGSQGNGGGGYSSPVPSHIQEMQDRMAEQQRQMEQRMEESRLRREAQLAEQRARQEQQEAERLARQQQQNSHFPSGPSINDHASRHAPTPQYTPSIPETPLPSYEPRFEQVVEYTCGSCNQVVSSNVQAGDNCPHCGIRFGYKEDEHGRREYASGGSGISGRSIRGGISLIVIILGALGALIRRFNS